MVVFESGFNYHRYSWLYAGWWWLLTFGRFLHFAMQSKNSPKISFRPLIIMGSMAFHGHANSPNHPISPKKSCKNIVNTHTMGPPVITIALNPNTIKARLSSTPSCVCVKTFWSCVSQNKNNRNKSFNFKKASQNKTVKSIGKSGSFQKNEKISTQHVWTKKIC